MRDEVAALATIMRVGNRLVPLSVNILFSLHTAKGNPIPGSDAKQQKLSVPRLIDATSTYQQVDSISLSRARKTNN